MNTTKAIEFLMEEPETKTNSRLKLEKDFFTTTKIRWKKNTNNPNQKHLVLSLDENDGVWSNGLLWLSVIHDHMTTGDFTYTIEYEHSDKRCVYNTAMTSNGNEHPDDVVRLLRTRYSAWEENREYVVVFDGVFDANAKEIFPETPVRVISVSEDGQFATTENGYVISINTLIDGDITKI